MANRPGEVSQRLAPLLTYMGWCLVLYHARRDNKTDQETRAMLAAQLGIKVRPEVSCWGSNQGGARA